MQQQEIRSNDLMVVKEPPPSGVARWLPAVVVMGTMVGFIALAWYAYHAGTESIKEDDLLVVEAEKTPIKEKPVDPGGMQFPNQDKTIFETFSNNSAPPPKVERVLPAPEEPMPANLDTSGTNTWINDSLHKQADESQKPAVPGKPEQVIPINSKPVEDKKPIETIAVPTPTVSAYPIQSGGDQTETYVATKSVVVASNDVDHVPVAAPQPEAQKTVEKKPDAVSQEEPKELPKIIKIGQDTPPAQPAVIKPAAIKKVAESAPAAEGTVKVQLGAYRSEAEAMDAWGKMQKKYADLAAMSPVIIKADLGTRGIYYRLRTGQFASNAQATGFCSKLSAGGQPCILPTGH